MIIYMVLRIISNKEARSLSDLLVLASGAALLAFSANC